MRKFATIKLLAAVVLMMISGCAWNRQATTTFPPPPVVFSETPTIEALTAAINRADRVTKLSSNTTTVEVLSGPKSPRLTNSTLYLQRDRQFRLRASVPVLMGLGVDIGSNDERFWFQVPEGVTKTLYYARHDQYRQQLQRAVLPVDPTWLMDALGLVHIDPATVIAGPVQRPDGKLEIRSTITLPAGIYQRVCLVEAQAGYVTDQYLYSPSGQLIAQCQSRNHVYYPETECALPHQVDISLIPAGANPPLTLRIDIGQYTVNQILSGDPNLFVMPQTATRAIDLTTLGQPAPGIAPIQYRAQALKPNPIRGSLR